MISVVIPTLNESPALEQSLRLLARNGAAHEIIVADGGSRDDTTEIASRMSARVISAPTGRASQMNAGAQRATGEILFFLHADTHVQSTSLDQIKIACQRPGTVGGAFARRFDSPSAWLKFTCGLATLRSRWLGLFLGDQGIFVQRAAFEKLGGFRAMPRFEDLDLSRRLRRVGRVVTLIPGIVSSARRFDRRGPFRTTCADLWLTCRYFAALEGSESGS